MTGHRGWVRAVLLTTALVMGAATSVSAQWQIESKDGKSNIKVGFLATPQLETIDTPDGSKTSTNLFLRRFRILFGGKISDKWTFFFETDSPNLGKANPDTTANPTGAKDAGNMFIQDAFITYNHNDAFKVDAGMIISPLGHNHGQSAATLLAIDYGPYTFLESGPLGERTGRDYGIQFRGYPFKQHLEYRLALFQGVRGPAATKSLRTAGRVVIYPFAADTGFFYAGTFQATKRVLGIGAAFDYQEKYRVYSADVFLEQPINGGRQGVTFQANWMRYDGRTFLTALPKQDEYLVEAGVHFGKGRVSPFVQYAARDFSSAASPDQKSWQAGVAYWIAGHQRNLKVGAGQVLVDGKPHRTQVVAQMQIYFY